MINEVYIEMTSIYGCKLEHLLLTHEQKSNSLVVLFPGKGYTCDRPLLHYANMVSLFKGCDVLSLEYGFYVADIKFVPGDFDKVVEELSSIINKCTLNSYSNIYFISKSIGTLFAGELSLQMSEYNIKNLFLTPLKETIPYIKSTNCLSVTGSRDNFFPSSSIDYVRNNVESELVIIEDADHNLETEISVEKNLEILQQIVNVYEKFLIVY